MARHIFKSSLYALVFAFLAFAPVLARAQVPAVPPIADTDRYQFSAIISSTATIALNFPVFGNGSDLTVKVNGALLDSSLWTFASNSGTALNIIALPVTDGIITFNPALTTGLLEIFGAWHPRQLVQPTAPGINRREFNQTTATIIAGMRELYSGVNSGKLTVATNSQALATFSQIPANTFLGNPLGVTGNVSTLTPAQALTLLSVGSIAVQGGYGVVASVASASTVDLGLQSATHNVSVTGTTTITSFGSSAVVAAPNYQVTSTSALVLANSTNLVLPGGANITTAAGDTWTATYQGAGKWQVIDYQTASGLPVVSNTAKSGLCSAYGLQIFNDASFPLNRVDINADGAQLTTAAGVPVTRTGLALVINAATVGANGMDAGGLSSSSWVNVWLIDNGTSSAGLLSYSATAPTLPSGYTYACRFGSMRVDSSGNLLRTRQTGAKAQYIVGNYGPIATLGAITGGSGYTNGTYNNILLTGNGFFPSATANITVSGGAVTAVTLVLTGNSYATTNILTAHSSTPLPVGSGFQIPVASVTNNTAAMPVMASGVVGNVAVGPTVAISLASYVPPTATRINGTLSSSSNLNAQSILAPNAYYGPITSTTNPPPVVADSIATNSPTLIPFDFIIEGSLYWASFNNGYVFALGWNDKVNAN